MLAACPVPWRISLALPPTPMSTRPSHGCSLLRGRISPRSSACRAGRGTPLGVVQRITSAIFIMNGRLDRIVPCRDAAEGSARSGAVELVIARNGNQVANNRAYRLRPFGADWMTEQLRAAAQRQSAHGGISRELGKRSKGRTGSFLHPLRRPTRPTRQAHDAPPTRQKSLGKAFSRLKKKGRDRVDIFGPSRISMIVTSTSLRIAVATIKAIISSNIRAVAAQPRRTD